ncbi:ATP-binding cassette domain-containing protein [Comamonas sp. 4034]|uniref:ATP-binding cassette domain-containing protein n=1 Tax=Comamonas sp. 4034 TaxID=3156455 RepID=UPI003D1E9370
MFKPFEVFRESSTQVPDHEAQIAINKVAKMVAQDSCGSPSVQDSGWQLDRLEVGVPGGDVLVRLHAHIAPGRLTAIVGPNGAGKSSLLATLTGRWAPHAGRVLLDGLPLSRWSAADLARRRAMMVQDGSVAFDFTVQEVVELGRYAHRLQPSRNEAAIVGDAMAATQMEAFAGRSVRSLSGGERARAHLARALAQVWEPPAGGQARWLLLDEPTAAMDLAWQHRSMDLLQHWAQVRGVGVVVVVHDMNLALRYADDALLVHGGGCLHGPVAEVLSPQTMRDVWGVGCFATIAPDGTQQYLFAGAGARVGG